MRAAWLLALGVLVATATPLRAQQSELIDVTGAVYLAWGFENVTESPPYSQKLVVHRGSTGCSTLGVWNTRSQDIRAVTLTMFPREGGVRFGYEVAAGDDPGEPFAYWALVPAHASRLACLRVDVPREATSLDADALLRFRLENGTEATAHWPMFGSVIEENRTPGPSLAILAAAIVVAAWLSPARLGGRA